MSVTIEQFMQSENPSLELTVEAMCERDKEKNFIDCKKFSLKKLFPTIYINEEDNININEYLKREVEYRIKEITKDLLKQDLTDKPRLNFLKTFELEPIRKGYESRFERLNFLKDKGTLQDFYGSMTASELEYLGF